jgi:Ser-tRNA(Ala) deacylase AlaX
MPVRKVFWEDPYLFEIETVITSADHNIITLDKTIAYAFSGGQQSDSGTIGGFEILDARKEGLEIYYTIPGSHTLRAGDSVIVKIDREKRYRIMRLHFAAELVLELVYTNYGRPEKVGANITSEKARVDFAWDGNISETFPLLEKLISEIVHLDTDIYSRFSDESDEIRYWEIPGFAKIPCGGTHLRKTGEVGEIRLKRINPGGGRERIEIYLVN